MKLTVTEGGDVSSVLTVVGSSVLLGSKSWARGEHTKRHMDEEYQVPNTGTLGTTQMPNGRKKRLLMTEAGRL